MQKIDDVAKFPYWSDKIPTGQSTYENGRQIDCTCKTGEATCPRKEDGNLCTADAQDKRKSDWMNWRRHDFIANFEGAHLNNATFEGAGIAGAVFKGADLTKVVFHDADISRADFTGAKNLESADFTNACGTPMPSDESLWIAKVKTWRADCHTAAASSSGGG